MLRDDWHLAHAVLSPYLNIGLLLPGEVCDLVEERYRAGGVPLSSAEGFIRQVIGWREYVWGLYWLRMPAFRDENVLGADEPLPPAFLGTSGTDMDCLGHTLDALDERGWAHHIQRLMVLANLSNLAGLEPRAVTDWMHARYVDGAEWVMVPNVIGMGLWADGGKMATKPYVSGGAYIDRMSDYCGGCRYDPRKRTGADACPFTSLYWDYLARHRTRLSGTHRMQQPLRGLDRLSDLPATRARAREARRKLRSGEL
jgi:deoxyribodipyrimidine photolyase-related protein